jgi:hypothetical protein
MKFFQIVGIAVVIVGTAIALTHRQAVADILMPLFHRIW